MSDIQTNLYSIIHWLEARRRPIRRILRDGLIPCQIKDKFESFGLYAPNELVELYSLYDGVESKEGDILDDLHLFPGYYFLSLRESLKHFQSFREDSRWSKDWLPIFANGGGDFYIIECNKETSDFPVIGFMLGRDDHEAEYESIDKMLFTIAECYREGVYFIDEDGTIESNISREIQIGKRTNPTLSYWRNQMV